MSSSGRPLSGEPFKLLKNRVWRTYSGGKFLEEWQGSLQAEDTSFPEEWVASTVVAKNVGREHIKEGLSLVSLDNGETMPLLDLILSDPQGFLGKSHVAKYGAQTALLVKVLDASERLTIQVHPDRAFAMEQFESQFGKTEAWYVMGGRAIDGEEPYVLFGFKPGVTKESWRELFERQDIDGMIDALHRIPVQEGDVFLVEGGIPHAIGSGCFLIEIQEPTDLTLRVERTTPKGNSVPDLACHQGIGIERMLDCFHYESHSYENARSKWKKSPALLRESEDGKELVLIGKESTDRFRMHTIEVTGCFSTEGSGVFGIAIVISGSGSVSWADGEMSINQSDEIFMPAGLNALSWNSDGADKLKVVLCYPPE
ncbi:type I phosphomannose isomerase catalytic subunit [Paenibacillus radicis (ex Xue et al. 2023)]|uniref:Class I mannose-6-phosphate isomerase n=1 Tax=Paenibacillus radicis (ex Xue et al. 2023) TaxID=2972489 RepID=A0ABT1YMW9_9BACL|nr:type I phosphomannose isomerase catalytic subunit [Paenibacillus radicis (ex Xue et al. 2023)]MCR8633749.1 class I mannose-6-phosphate isomerase [Paenibacillus radicis (ex Xue et al. 2023)]